MSEKKPLDKKPIRDLLTEKDAFLTTSEKFQEYLLRHTKGAIITFAVVAVAVAAAALYLSHQGKAEKEATLAYENSLVKMAASESDGIAALEKVRTDFAQRKAARLAAFRLLSVYAANKELDKALPLAEDLLKTIKPAESALKPALLSTLGGFYEDKKDYQQAAKSYETLLAMDYLGPNLKLDVLMALGRVYTAADRKDDAMRNYERVIREHPQTLQAFMANSKLAELKGTPVAFPLPDDDLPTAAASGTETSVTAEEPAAVTPAVEAVGDQVSEPGPAAGTDEAAPGESADETDVDVESGAPLPPNVAPHEERADGKASEPAAE